MKKVNGLFKPAKILPFPQLTALFRLQQDPPFLQVKDKCILKSGGFLINAQGQQAADRDPQKEPEKGKKQERKGLDLFERKQQRRQDRESIDNDNEGPYFRPAEKMAAQSVQHLFLIVSKLNCHQA